LGMSPTAGPEGRCPRPFYAQTGLGKITERPRNGKKVCTVNPDKRKAKTSQRLRETLKTQHIY